MLATGSTDRLAALRDADDAKRDPAGPGLGRLSLIVRVPIEGGDVADASGAIGWAELLERAAAVPAGVATARAAAVAPGDVSDIMFTSGTTGRSKGAMTAHRQSLAVARAWAECGRVSGADRYLVVNPFFHTFGFKAGILACLVSGAALVPQLVYDAGQAMALVEAERITVFPGPPTIYQTILDHPDRGPATCPACGSRSPARRPRRSPRPGPFPRYRCGGWRPAWSRRCRRSTPAAWCTGT